MTTKKVGNEKIVAAISEGFAEIAINRLKASDIIRAFMGGNDHSSWETLFRNAGEDAIAEIINTCGLQESELELLFRPYVGKILARDLMAYKVTIEW